MDLRRNSQVNVALLIGTALSLGCALACNDGRYSVAAVSLLAVTCALTFIALLRSSQLADSDRRQPASVWLLAIVVAIYLLAGALRIQRSPQPFMDVFDFQTESVRALREGKNPYAITMPDIYGEQGGWVYAPQLRQEGRLAFGFPYMPLTLLWDSLAPDFRYLNLLAIAVAGVLIWLINRSWLGALAAALLLLTPKGLYIIEKGWTEPLPCMLLALVIFLSQQRSRSAASSLAIAFGLLIASKQYCVLLIPFVPMMRRSIVLAATTALLATLPFVLSNPTAFWRSVVTLQFIQPFRDDSLSFTAALVHTGGPHISGVISIVAALALAIFCAIRKIPLALSIAVVFLLFFSVNKQAFGNYYLFVLAAICCAIPLTRSPANVR